MSILSSNFFTARTNTEVNSGTTDVQMSSGVSDAGKQALLDMLDSLSPGDTILGKVLSQSGKNLSIKTLEGNILNAQNDGKILFEKGSSILFEVQSKAGKTLSLRPLYQNTSLQKTAEVALNQAGLPINERSIEMTGRNMEYGNPIDRDSLISSFKDVALFPNASVKSIIDLQQMKIPVNEENIEQYNSYMKMENSISAVTGNLADEIMEFIGRDVFAIDESGNVVNASINFNLLEDISVYLSETGFKGDASVNPDELLKLFEEGRNAGISLNNLDNLVASSENEINALDVFRSIVSDLKNPVFTGGLNVQPETVEGTETLNPETINEGLNINLLNDFISGESLKSVLKKALNSRWSLEQNKFGDKSEIKILYERIYSESKGLADIVGKNIEDKASQLKNMLSDVTHNIEFMNDLNKFIPYIQIPFHNDDNRENSELYVYSNKNGGGSAGGEVSAFIHLDMDHLGPTDVYVKLNGEHVSTNFTLKDEDTLVFLEHHLDFLNKRLGEKGFSTEFSLNTGKETKPMLENVLNETQKHLVLEETSFDARV